MPSATDANTSSSNATRQAARDPVSFEAGDEGTTDVRQETAHARRHDQAPQRPDQVGCQDHGSGGDDNLQHDARSRGAGGAGHGVRS